MASGPHTAVAAQSARYTPKALAAHFRQRRRTATPPPRRTTAFTCRAGCKELDLSKNRNAGPVKRNAWSSRDPAVFVQPCRLTMALIQIGAKGDVQPFETG